MPVLIGAIIGATGVGKTELAVRLAESIGAEIINMDSRQIYRGMAIGTAQPSSDQLNRVPHHLVDFLNPDQTYSAAKYLHDVRNILSKQPNTHFILVGGTGLYLQVLQQGLSPIPESDPHLRKKLNHILERKGLPWMFAWAKRLDPQIENQIDPLNTQRVLRVLEVCLQTHKTWTSQMDARVGGFGEFPVLWVDRERTKLHQRIADRVDQMVKDGWQNEALFLSTLYSMDAPGLQSLGYKELILNGTRSLSTEFKQSIIAKTRQYAKRQLTWFRHQIQAFRLVLDTPKNDDFEEISQEMKKYFKIP